MIRPPFKNCARFCKTLWSAGLLSAGLCLQSPAATKDFATTSNCCWRFPLLRKRSRFSIRGSVHFGLVYARSEILQTQTRHPAGGVKDTSWKPGRRSAMTFKAQKHTDEPLGTLVAVAPSRRRDGAFRHTSLQAALGKSCQLAAGRRRLLSRPWWNLSSPL